tara:strand:- start:3225 stop:3431 length:207 start_codon:yes stop_codon:yes gene_type:complete
MNQINGGGINSGSICADADWPTAPPKLTQKGISVWTTHILASVFSVYLKLKYYHTVCMYQSEKEIGSL